MTSIVALRSFRGECRESALSAVGVRCVRKYFDIPHSGGVCRESTLSGRAVSLCEEIF